MLHMVTMAAKGEELTELILRNLSEKESVDSYQLSVEIGKDHQLLVGAIKSLQSVGDVRMESCAHDGCGHSS